MEIKDIPFELGKYLTDRIVGGGCLGLKAEIEVENILIVNEMLTIEKMKSDSYEGAYIFLRRENMYLKGHIDCKGVIFPHRLGIVDGKDVPKEIKTFFNPWMGFLEQAKKFVTEGGEPLSGHERSTFSWWSYGCWEKETKTLIIIRRGTRPNGKWDDGFDLWSEPRSKKPLRPVDEFEAERIAKVLFVNNSLRAH